MINYIALEDAIYTIVAAILTPNPVIIARQAAPAPNSSTLPYTILQVGNLTQKGREIIGTTGATGTAEVKADYQVSVEFQSYGTGSRDDMAKLEFAFNTPTTVESFLAAGLALVNHPILLDIPKVINTEWEETSLLTVTFNLADVNDSDTGFINKVTDLTGTINDVTGATARTTTNTIDGST